jgi:hypothetical protein
MSIGIIRLLKLPNRTMDGLKTLQIILLIYKCTLLDQIFELLQPIKYDIK